MPQLRDLPNNSMAYVTYTYFVTIMRRGERGDRRGDRCAGERDWCGDRCAGERDRRGDQYAGEYERRGDRCVGE